MHHREMRVDGHSGKSKIGQGDLDIFPAQNVFIHNFFPLPSTIAERASQKKKGTTDHRKKWEEDMNE
jgi:hypothetical protein